MSTNVSFSPSKLGTKEHWDNVYRSELTTFEETGNEGEIWFGEDIVEKMRDWVSEHVPVSRKPRILDVGSGNGNLLFSLWEAGYQPASLVGIDYSTDAVRLAQSIASTRNAQGMRFLHVDFLQDNVKGILEPILEGTDIAEHPTGRTVDNWDVVLDKGTYDAIALSYRKDDGALPLDMYASKVVDLVSPGGFFLITSCNFTEEELLRAFQRPESSLSFHSRIKHRTMTFGGMQGSTYTTIAFQNKDKVRMGSDTTE